jgi:hypothetical protein
MEGSVLSFLKAEWKVSDTGSAHWASSLYIVLYYMYANVPPYRSEFFNKIFKK